jgi:glycosyltransferase involved in cell wall biosynthesis
VAPDVGVPGTRGASTHVLELSAALKLSGDEVHVVCSRLPGQPETQEIRGVTFHRVYRLPGGILLPSAASGAASRKGIDGAASLGYRFYLQTVNAARVGSLVGGIIKRHGLDAIIERETAYGAGAFASVITGRPMVLEIIGPRTSPLSVARSSKLLAYSTSMVPEKALEKAEYVEAAVNPGIFKPDRASGLKVRERLGLTGTVIGYAGTFQSFHGINDLLGASALALGKRPDLRFLMVGPRSEEASALAKALGVLDKMTFAGPVPYEEVASYLNASDILVAPYNTKGTDREQHGIGSPLKVLEYMAVGKAVIGSALPQLETMIKDGATGRLFPEGDVGRLGELIVELANDPGQRERLGREALNLVRERYTWAMLARRVNQIVLNSKRGKVA